MARGNLHQRLIERRCRRRIDCRRARPFKPDIRDGTIDRAHAALDLGGGGASLADQLVEPTVEAGNGVADAARSLLGDGPASRLIAAGKLLDLTAQTFKALVNRSQILVGRPPVAVVVVGVAPARFPARALILLIPIVFRRCEAVIDRRIDNDGIEPLPDRHSGAARGFLRGLARLPADTFNLPRNARFHARVHNFGRKERGAGCPVLEPAS